MNSLYPFAPRRTISDICTTAKPLKNISYLNAAHGIILHPSIRKHIPPRSLFLKDSVLFHSIQRDRGGSSTPLQALLSSGKERQTPSGTCHYSVGSSQQRRTLAYMSAFPLLKNFRSPDSTFHSDVVCGNRKHPCRIQSEHKVYAEFSAAGRTASHFTGPSVGEQALISLLRCSPVL